MDHFLYTGARTREISFPLGGIGAGCIGLAGNGRLVDWEIFNRPNKGSLNGFSHFAIKAESQGQVVDARVLHGDLHPPYSGELLGGQFGSFGFGPRREHLAGLPHFISTRFRGEFPLAELDFESDKFPGQVRLRAFSPFIPLNDRDSSLPAAFFEIEVVNTSAGALDYSLVGVLSNPLPAPQINHYQQQGTAHLLYLDSAGLPPEDLEYGNLVLATDAAEVSVQQYWFRGAWFDNLGVYWHDLTSPGRLKDRVYERDPKVKGSTGMLAAHLRLEPGERGAVRFLIAWHFPNVSNTWNPEAAQGASEAGLPKTWRNYYAALWEDAAQVGQYALAHWDRLAAETRLFHDTLFSSDLPPAALDAVSANLSILKSPTVLRLEDGTFYGFEGCHPSSGCCEGSCTHVWNYAQALPFLFPALERSMREADYRYNLEPDGAMPFRLQLPLGAPRWKFRPCADGQFGGVMKVYRDWKIYGDTGWLRGLWSAVKASIEYAWSESNQDRWDPERSGVLTGRQHHTLDMELFGPNAWLTGFYLGALKAGAEMADALGETETAALYREIFNRGKAWTDRSLFNGEYYQQQIDLNDRALVAAFDSGQGSMTGGTLASYWDEEHGEVKYQAGEGCLTDQALAQWHANLYGLGEIFDPAQVRQSAGAIFRYNFIPTMRDYPNPCRVFALNDEGGLVICSWPAGRRKPVIGAPYSEETMHGFEYAAAILMIQVGLVEQGMAVVEAVRRRYDGERRNPWNEIECGSNYARSMASYALLNAFSGFSFDAVRAQVGFDPIQVPSGGFRCFWSLDSGWGQVRVDQDRLELRVLVGRLPLRSLGLPAAWSGQALVSAVLQGAVQSCRLDERVLRFDDEIVIEAGQSLVISMQRN